MGDNIFGGPSPVEEGPTPTAAYLWHSGGQKKGKILVKVRVEGNGEDAFEYNEELDGDMTIGEMRDLYYAQMDAQLPRAPLQNHPTWGFKLYINKFILTATRRVLRDSGLADATEYLRYRPLDDMRHARIHNFIRRGDTLVIRIFDERGVQKVWDGNLKTWRNAGDGEDMMYLRRGERVTAGEYSDGDMEGQRRRQAWWLQLTHIIRPL
ncbi:hypothetical protein TWF696_002666 [Orbilia brochopaga]|uniref:Uncharacterized protein n=1 Tax=Orbilia brochopaga TaxID=3140254 RepID=A0AAV9U3H2_9PEZI